MSDMSLQRQTLLPHLSKRCAQDRSWAGLHHQRISLWLTWGSLSVTDGTIPHQELTCRLILTSSRLDWLGARKLTEWRYKANIYLLLTSRFHIFNWTVSDGNAAVSRLSYHPIHPVCSSQIHNVWWISFGSILGRRQSLCFLPFEQEMVKNATAVQKVQGWKQGI